MPNYDVLEESRNAVKNLEENAWANHRDKYIQTKAATEDFNGQIDFQELNIKTAATKEDIEAAQDELTKIINDIEDFDVSFNSDMIVRPAPKTSLLQVNDNNLFSQNDMFNDYNDNLDLLDIDAINDFLNKTA